MKDRDWRWWLGFARCQGEDAQCPGFQENGAWACHHDMEPSDCPLGWGTCGELGGIYAVFHCSFKDLCEGNPAIYKSHKAKVWESRCALRLEEPWACRETAYTGMTKSPGFAWEAIGPIFQHRWRTCEAKDSMRGTATDSDSLCSICDLDCGLAIPIPQPVRAERACALWV